MFVNKTYDSINEQYAKATETRRANRTNLKVDGRRVPPSWRLDEIADQKLTAGYNSKNKNCSVCFEKKSLTGSCYCTI